MLTQRLVTNLKVSSWWRKKKTISIRLPRGNKEEKKRILHTIFLLWFSFRDAWTSCMPLVEAFRNEISVAITISKTFATLIYFFQRNWKHLHVIFFIQVSKLVLRPKAIVNVIIIESRLITSSTRADSFPCFQALRSNFSGCPHMMNYIYRI